MFGIRGEGWRVQGVGLRAQWKSKNVEVHREAPAGGFRVCHSLFNVWVVGLGLKGLRFGVEGLGFEVWGLGFGV